MEHDNQVCDKYNAIIPHLEKANHKISELHQTVNKQDSLVCNKCNSLIPVLKNDNHKIAELEKIAKDLHRDNYLLNKVLEKISPESDLNKRLNSSIESEESEDTSIHYHQDSASQTNFNSLNSTVSSSTTGTDCSVQTSPTQNNRDFSTQTKAVSHQKSPSPTKKTKSPSSKTTPPQSNTLVNLRK